MKHSWLILAATLLGSSCASPDADSPAEQTPSHDESAVSGLTLALTSADSQNRLYRLRAATFTVQRQDSWWGGDAGSASSSTTLFTEDDPDADQLSVRLTPGAYTVELGGEWYLERITPNGPERVEQVVLLGAPVQFAFVDSGWNYDVEFRFGVDGTLIDFRYGDLNIGIGIELPGEQGSRDAGIQVDGGFGFADGGVLPPDGGLTFGDGGSVIFL